ncbi:PREDICTED: GTP-binding protein 10 homolog [Nicrophorus vespilloides]|uniref:GTP-binding protein 10 homolog n=1 Tax=Nicrophorus vespilloides TaxID=110193 RepID=A0ABM1MT44_NICVS|nr:PREDICTED: GTP-binding protein 10 homolog [Nicrophorus vespilloides]
MVFITKILFFAKSTRIPRQYVKSGFTDSLRLFVKGGAGGNGLPKFGGIGGQGGNISVVAKESITLDDVFKANRSKRIFAKDGKNSSHNFILGPPGDNINIEVPVGVTVYSDEGKKLGELNKEGDQILVAKGGYGGHPKNGFMGKKGQSYSIKLDLKLIADIGLVGFPNAGKSTLLKAISHAKPKIANYPFTTIRPNLGIIMYKDLRQISMADLPGLIEGAHNNRGMGHKFLKHVERTKLLLLVVDINGFQLGPQYDFRSCIDTIVLLNKELEMYNKDLLNKPAMIIINKMDSEGAMETFKSIEDKIKNLSEIFKDYPEEYRPEQALKFEKVLAISAKENVEDIGMVKTKLRKTLDVFAEIQEEGKQEDNSDMFKKMKDDLKERAPLLV